jgi:hypothetical protein
VQEQGGFVQDALPVLLGVMVLVASLLSLAAIRRSGIL